MTVSEKVAYLKGLAEGYGLDAEKKEGKLILAIIDTLEDIAGELEALNENAGDIVEELSALSESFSDMEEILFSEDDDDVDDEDNCCCSGCCDDDDDDDEASYGVVCPHCREDIIVTEEDLIAGEIQCPKCGEKLEFDFDDEEEEE
jgi:DNA-directed RNA polymerase subunit RPC12/RpoP